MPTILIIDDEPAIAEVVAEVLLDEGYETLTANRGRDALDIMAEHRPDLMLLDVYMPEMSGLDLLAHIQGDAALSLIPVVVMTAGTMSELDLSRTGAAQVISKPFNVDDLIATVRTLV
ncbi:MAG: response regulator [Chloroflexales bacterium]|nr:response regulator [Chloroflexales bacterium]